MGLEEILEPRDGVGDARHQRMAVLRVVDGGLQHVAQSHGAMVAQQQHPGVERARDHGGQQAIAGNQRQAFGAVAFQRGAGGRAALAAQHFNLARAGRIEHGRRLAGGRPVRLDHLQHEGAGDAGVEGVAAALQQGHAGGAGQPVGRGHDTEGAEDFRTSREHHDGIEERKAEPGSGFRRGGCAYFPATDTPLRRISPSG